MSLVFASLPEAVLGGCTVMMFGNIIVSGFQMIANAGFSQRNITIAALSLAVGIGFTQMGDIFTVLPELLQSVFADNCVAVTFVVAIAASLLLPKDAQVEGPLVTHNEGVGSPAGETLYDVPGEMPGEMPEAVACDSAADLAREAAFGGTGDGAEAERVEKTERTAAE